MTRVYARHESWLCETCLLHKGAMINRFLRASIYLQSRSSDTGWRRCIGCLTLLVSFRERATVYSALLPKKKNYKVFLRAFFCREGCMQRVIRSWDTEWRRSWDASCRSVSAKEPLFLQRSFAENKGVMVNGLLWATLCLQRCMQRLIHVKYRVATVHRMP